ncbi:MAG: glycosyltransferase family 1 protein [Anaerolineales bacterium]|nr:glycosyltransferase family 1 protein [Anaerolineales bacterium]
MHITLLALGSRGDVQPYAVLGSGLKSARHQIRFITFESFAPLVAEIGLDFHPIPGDAQAVVAGGATNMLGLVRSFTNLAQGYARSLSDPHLGETDLIINQLPGGLYGFDLAEKYNLPMMLASVIPLARTDTMPLMGFPNLPLPGYNRMTYSIGEKVLWQMFRSVINEWRTQTLKLPPLPRNGYFDQLGTRKFPILNGFSEHVVLRPADWNEHIHITGYWFAEEKRWDPPKGLLGFLDAGKPPVFIGFGSMPVKNPRRTTEIILEALERSGQRGILHSGWGGLGEISLPDTVFKIDYAPYNWLFPRMSMIFHHGGSGTTAYALRSGVPSCVIPFVFDQFYWGQRIAKLGVGPTPIPFKKMTAKKLQQAIEGGTRTSEIRRRAAEIGKKVRSENGVRATINLIEILCRTLQ